ncbi:hypothetical protein AGMMS49942_04370 [Spirochaetia bacterium]|nr:hypothetical protein AGMMS49942_04370 [Spirochaetia bacterium]
MNTLEVLGALGSLAVFSGLSLNLLLQFGLSVGGIIEPASRPSPPHWLILFVSSFVLWLFFTYVLAAPAFGFLESFLFFPAAMLVSLTLESVFVYFFPSGVITRDALRNAKKGPWKPWEIARDICLNSDGLPRYSGNGLAAASVFLTLRLALTLVDALVLCLGFSLGCLVAAAILREINKRSSLESAPQSFRGAPLTLISMGLLSLIFSSVSVILIRVLGGR